MLNDFQTTAVPTTMRFEVSENRDNNDLVNLEHSKKVRDRDCRLPITDRADSLGDSIAGLPAFFEAQTRALYSNLAWTFWRPLRPFGNFIKARDGDCSRGGLAP